MAARCNLRDARGMGVPVFGPVAVEQTFFATEPAPEWQAAGPFPCHGFATLEAPTGATFHALPPAPRWSGQDGVVFLRAKAFFPEPMEVELRFGHDAPAHWWANGVKFHADMEGGPPIGSDKFVVPLPCPRGEVEFVAALRVLPDGFASGVKLRISREGGGPLPVWLNL